MAEFLIASAILTIVLNVVIRLPVVRDGIERWLASLSTGARPDRDHNAGLAPDPRPPHPERRRVQVFFPWKAMLVASLALTLLVNLANLLF